MAEPKTVSEPYSDETQQHDAAMLGMYIFLASEVMLFGGIFVVAAVMRLNHPMEFVEASKALHFWLGAINTGILLTSSLCVALGVPSVERGTSRGLSLWFVAAAVLGLSFISLKFREYGLEFREGLLPIAETLMQFESPTQHAFMNIYLIATGLHAIHLSIGILLLLWVAILSPRRKVVPTTIGLYWHLVDVVWIFLYPILYLAR